MFDFIPISTRDVLGLLLTNILEFYSYIHNAPSIRTQFFLCLPYFIQSGDRTCLEALFHYKSALFQMSSFSTLFSFLNLQHLIITYLFGVAWQHAPPGKSLVSHVPIVHERWLSAQRNVNIDSTRPLDIVPMQRIIINNIAIHKMKESFQFTEVIFTVHGGPRTGERDPITLATLSYTVRYHLSSTNSCCLFLSQCPQHYTSVFLEPGIRYAITADGPKYVVSHFCVSFIWEHIVASYPSTESSMVYYVSPHHPNVFVISLLRLVHHRESKVSYSESRWCR